MQTIRVETPSAKYDVMAGSGLVESLAPRIERVRGQAAAAGLCADLGADLGAVGRGLPAVPLPSRRLRCFCRPAKNTRRSRAWKACCGRWRRRAGIAAAC